MPSLSYLGLRKPPDKAQPVNYRPLAAVTGKHMFVIGDNLELVCFNLVTNVWSQMNCKDSFSEINERKNGMEKISTPHKMKWRTKKHCSVISFLLRKVGFLRNFANMEKKILSIGFSLFMYFTKERHKEIYQN